ncbi:MAG: hypothetical protein ABI156_06100 [Caldimonas sp.]
MTSRRLQFLVAAEAVGYESIGIERDAAYFIVAKEAISRLAKLRVDDPRP